MIRRRRDPIKLQRMRQFVQLLFLALFAFLLTKALMGRVMGSWMPVAALALATVVLTLVLGRVWCGWVCPVNTVLDRLHVKGSMERGGRLHPRWSVAKYVVLLLILLAVLAGLGHPLSQWVGSLSPERAPSQLLVGFGSLAFTLVIIIGLEIVAARLWCRVLCPLGATLALLARVAPMRRVVHSHCNECSVCVDSCPMGIIDPARGFKSDTAECTVCVDCLAVCTSSSNGFRFSRSSGGR